MTNCPDESELLAMLDQTALPLEWREHQATCARCCELVTQLQQQIATLRQTFSGDAHPADESESQSGRPAFIDKYFIVGLLAQDDDLLQYRALHALLHQEVVLSIAKHPTGQVATNPTPLDAAYRPLSQLSHPHAARLLDVGSYQDRAYVVEEYLPGKPLVESAAARGLDWRARTRQVAQLGEVVIAMRAAGILDLDLSQLQLLGQDDSGAVITGLAPAILRRQLGTPTAAPVKITPQDDLAQLNRWLRQVLMAGHESGPDTDDPQQLYADLRMAHVPHRLARLCAECAKPGECILADTRELTDRLRQITQRHAALWWATIGGLILFSAAALWLLRA